jgi:hypothetical protein
MAWNLYARNDSCQCQLFYRRCQVILSGRPVSCVAGDRRRRSCGDPMAMVTALHHWNVFLVEAKLGEYPLNHAALQQKTS